ncbi:MAG: ribose-5-phosphate isomerase RpiA [Acidobacteriia bacterium]|nr:ribose-5-phosphate isomerase RpiA [Terriglobia bacterium]
MPNDQEKEAAARASLRFVRDGDIVGLGSGSTAACAIRLLGDKVKAGLRIRGIATSVRSQELAASLGIPIITFDECQQLDVAIDGADEIDPQLCLIKGGGGALLREKVVASAARQFVVIADSSKQVSLLGKFPLPVEVIPFAQILVARRITALGAAVNLRKSPQGNPYTTDEGHHILDCTFGQIPDPAALARVLSDMPGVVEHGLFIGMANVVLIGKGDKVLELSPTTKT